MCGHEVDGLDGAQGDDPFVGAGVTDDANGFHRQEDGERLTGLVVPARLAQFVDEDGIGLGQQISKLGLTSPRIRTPRPGPGNGCR